MQRANLAALLLGLLLSAAAGAQSVYVWEDGDGNLAYGDSPPPGANATLLPLRYRGSDPATIRERAREQRDSDEVARLRREEDARREATDTVNRAEVARQMEENCRQARQMVEQYDTAQRLYRTSASGEREYLTAEEIDRARLEARQAVADWCAD